MQFTHITTREAAADLNRRLPDIIALDTETTGLNPRTDKLLSFSIATSDNEAYHIPAEFLPHINLNRKLLFLHNFKFDYNVLYNNGVNLIDTPCVDSMLMHHLIDENAEHGLDALVQAVYSDNYKELFWQRYQTIEEASPEDLLEYTCKDVIYTYRLCKLFLDKLKDKRGLIDHVHRLAKALYKTERDGILIDWVKLEHMKADYTARIADKRLNMRTSVETECNLWELAEWKKELDKRKTERGKNGVAKPQFSFDSNKQLGELLYDMLGLPEQKKKNQKKQLTRTVDDAALAALGNAHSILPEIREYRGLQKMLSTYIEGLVERREGQSIYPSFNVNGTVTGRISHSDPNMGNWPRESEIRHVLVPRPGYKFIDADYSQIEICLAAHFSKDPILIELVKAGKSMHDYTAKEVGIERQVAKMVNFLTIYGGSEYKLSNELKISIERAKEILERLWIAYKGLKSAIDQCHRLVDTGKPIINPFGRMRRFGTQFESRWDKERARRQAFNALIQGTAADLCNRSFYLMSERLAGNGAGRALFTVHDEIICEVKAEVAEQEAKALQEIMINCGRELELLVPLSTECKVLEHWEK